MSQQGASMPQDVHGNPDLTAASAVTIKMEHPNISNSGERRTGIRENSIDGDSITVNGEERGEAGGDGSSSGVSQSMSKSMLDEGDFEIKDDMTVSGEGCVNNKGKGKRIADKEREIHIWTERERRKKMRNMFNSLHALLPMLPDKTDKATIVGETIHYIKSLEDTLQKLEKMKLDRLRAQQQQQQHVGAGCSHAPVSALPRAAPAPTPASRETTLAELAHGWNAQADHQPAGAVTAAPPPLQSWSGPNITLSIAGGDAFINLSMPRKRGAFTTTLFVLEKHGIDVVTSTVSNDQSRNLFSLHVRVNPAASGSENLTPEDRYKLAVSELMLWFCN